MKILLVGTKKSAEDTKEYYKYYLEFFNNSIKSADSSDDISLVLLDELIISVGDGEFEIFDTRNKCYLSEYDLFFIRGHVRGRIDEVRAVSEYVKNKGKTVINDYSGFRSSSKLIQAVQLHTQSLPVPKTVFLTPAVIEHKDKLAIQMPCIMKDVFGSHGSNNVIIHDFNELAKVASQHPNVKFVLQRYVPNENDYRILIAGNNCIIIKRLPVSGSHLNNTSEGGRAEIIEQKKFPGEIIEKSKSLAMSLGMTIAGVDVIYNEDTGDYYFLEINSQPQLMSGAFVDRKVKLIGNLINDLSGRKFSSR